MNEPVALSLFDSLGRVPDPRLERTRLHQLVDILVIAMCATICAAETWKEIAEFGHDSYQGCRPGGWHRPKVVRGRRLICPIPNLTQLL
jgi:hypothetical protein